MDEAVNFRDLSPRDPRAATTLADRVRRSSLTWFQDRADANGTGQRLVIGVAVWSVYDLRLLDLMNEAVAGGSHPGLSVAVFNVDELPSPADLQRLLPGVGDVFHTPAVGYWDGGQLTETASGFAGRQLVGRVLGFDPQSVLQQPVTVG